MHESISEPAMFNRLFPLLLVLLLASSCGESSTDVPDIARPTSDSATSEDEGPAVPAPTDATAATEDTMEGTDSGPSIDAPSPTDTGVDEGPFEIPECGVPGFAPDSGLRRYPYLQDIQPTSGRIVWTSTREGVGAVEIATSADGPWERFEAVGELFEIAKTEDEVDYTAYEAVVTGLNVGRSYCYRVLLDDDVLAEGLRFTSAWTDPERPLRILAFGDSGNGSPDQLAVRDAFMEHEFDVFLHLGDMAYGSGTYVEFKRHVFDVYKEFLHKTVTWPTMGNHEYKTGGGLPYLAVYYLPEQAIEERAQERYYSFDYGNVHMVSFDSNDETLILAVLREEAGEPSMLSWLRDDLQSSDKPWKIVFFHHPPYSSSERDPNFMVRGHILPILEENGVDLVLTGHDHHYERTVPIWQGEEGTDDPTGLTYIIAGAGGAGLRVIEPEWWTAASENQKYSFVSLTIEGCTLTGNTIAHDGTSLDTFELNGCD